MLIDIDGVSPGLHPRLKMFLSADIVGSTPLKQPFDLQEPSSKSWFWAEIIEAFYQDMDDALKTAWETVASEISDALYGSDALQGNLKKIKSDYFGEPPHFWKTVGDEVIFWKDMENDFQIWFTLCAWMEATDKVRRILREKGAKRGASLDLKCTAWVAGFPVRNTAILAPHKRKSASENDLFRTGTTEEISGSDLDFIGPAIDIGFRISQWSTSYKFHVSLDLAYLLAITSLDTSVSDTMNTFMQGHSGNVVKQRIGRIKLSFEGTEYLKGVMGGLHYPRFWICSHYPGSLDEVEHAISANSERPVTWEEVRSYSTKFYDERSKYIFRPFINNPKSISHNHIHDDYRKLWRIAVRLNGE